VVINRSAILFSPSGNATPATLTLCDRRDSGRALVVSRSGRVRPANGQCGFAFAEVLAALFLLALGSLALAQNFLQARHSVATTALHATALNAVTAATEASRLLAPLPSAGPNAGPGFGQDDATSLHALWSGTFAASDTAGPSLVLHWQWVDGSTAWEATATASGLRVALEARP
jgi:Type II transport protein GspH